MKINNGLNKQKIEERLYFSSKDIAKLVFF